MGGSLAADILGCGSETLSQISQTNKQMGQSGEKAGSLKMQGPYSAPVCTRVLLPVCITPAHPSLMFAVLEVVRVPVSLHTGVYFIL